MSWDELLERSRNHDDLSDSRKVEAVKAFTELKAIFGDKFFEERHPLFGFFINRAAWTCEWAVWFSRTLQTLKQHPDFDRLVDDLMKPLRYGERMTVLSIADILASGGFAFQFDKRISIDGKPKMPDLFAQLDSNDAGLFVEVSELNPSEKQREAAAVCNELFQLITFSSHEFEFAGRCERVLSPPHLREVLKTIQGTIQKANRTGFETVDIPGVIHFALAAKSNSNELRVWCEGRELKPGEFRGPPVNVSEIDRLSFKLQKEQEQLPPNCSNIVVIYSHLFSDTPGTRETFEHLAQSIEDIVYKHSHICYLVLVFRWLGGNANEVLRLREHLCVNQQKYGFDCVSFMLFKNRFATFPIPARVEEKFLDGFLNQVKT